MRISALTIVLGLLFCAAPAAAQFPFYVATPAQISGAPGSVIRSEPMDIQPAGAAATRVLYRSTGLNGEPIAVSGVVIVPQGPAPAGGWPVIAWAHPTSGVIPRCAPSLANFLYDQIQGLQAMIHQGYIVVATDYPGLGTPQTHPYLVGISEGRAVLDSVRAARALVPNAQNRFAVWGHSQGGQASIYTGLLAQNYAPDLQLVGVAAAAPATDLAALFSDDINTNGGRNIAAMTLWSWSRIYDAPMDNVVYASAVPTVNALSQECIESVYDVIARHFTQRGLQQRFLSVDDITSVEPWRALMAKNSPGAPDPSIPVFLAQGSADQVVRPTVTEGYMGALCKAGSRVKFVWLPGVTHLSVARKSADAFVAWAGDRFAGRPAPSDCGS
ncbi:MAG TPA: alpha/beta fold hydrolase [Rhizomicrobium sp.]|jgi:acetyl esterase/lipase|nr:alpha/beta fold hydrolase [Rhizomicrobium sp.]